MDSLLESIEEDPKSDSLRPLADRMRPQRLEDVVGQTQLTDAAGPLGLMVASGNMSSTILWGPPGVGKTTIAKLLAGQTGCEFIPISAVFSNVAELKKIFEYAKSRWMGGDGTVLFVDEIHRFNKAQQDGFLPHMEDGTIILVGATTENPSFELNSALLSRAQVLVLRRLQLEDLEVLVKRAEEFYSLPLPVVPEARELLLNLADGDARGLLNLVERIFSSNPAKPLGPEALMHQIARRAAVYDKSGDWHYNLISALHKSVRGSDADASLYWLARMLEAGEDPRYLARRVARMAVEDIGLADQDALPLCLSAWEAYERLGSPEGELAIANAVIYLALAPKSNSAYAAFKQAHRAARETGTEPPPMHILNAPTKLMKSMGYSRGYQYDHDTPEGFSGQNYFPVGVERGQFYAPVERGFERTMKKRLVYFARLRRKLARAAEAG